MHRMEWGGCVSLHTQHIHTHIHSLSKFHAELTESTSTGGYINPGPSLPPLAATHASSAHAPECSTNNEVSPVPTSSGNPRMTTKQQQLSITTNSSSYTHNMIPQQPTAINEWILNKKILWNQNKSLQTTPPPSPPPTTKPIQTSFSLLTWSPPCLLSKATIPNNWILNSNINSRNKWGLYYKLATSVQWWSNVLYRKVAYHTTDDSWCRRFVGLPFRGNRTHAKNKPSLTHSIKSVATTGIITHAIGWSPTTHLA